MNIQLLQCIHAWGCKQKTNFPNKNNLVLFWMHYFSFPPHHWRVFLNKIFIKYKTLSVYHTIIDPRIFERYQTFKWIKFNHFFCSFSTKQTNNFAVMEPHWFCLLKRIRSVVLCTQNTSHCVNTVVSVDSSCHRSLRLINAKTSN